MNRKEFLIIRLLIDILKSPAILRGTINISEDELLSVIRNSKSTRKISNSDAHTLGLLNNLVKQNFLYMTCEPDYNYYSLTPYSDQFIKDYKTGKIKEVSIYLGVIVSILTIISLLT